MVRPIIDFNFGVVDPHPFEKEVFQKTIKKFQTAWSDDFALTGFNSLSFARCDGAINYSVFDLRIVSLRIDHDDFVCANGRPDPI